MNKAQALRKLVRVRKLLDDAELALTKVEFMIDEKDFVRDPACYIGDVFAPLREHLGGVESTVKDYAVCLK